MSTAVITDSNSGIFSDPGRSLGIYVVPMPVLVDGNTYYEGIDIDQTSLIDALYSGRDVSSSQPSPKSVTDLWDEALACHDSIIHIPMSSSLSSTCDTAKALAEDYDGRVVVADIRRISVPLRCSVEHALTLAGNGMDAVSIKEQLEDDADNSLVYISADTLRFLKKSGRITPAAASLGTVLNIKPVLSIQGGKLDAFARVHGMKKAKSTMIAALKTDVEALFPDNARERVIIAAADTFTSREAAEEWGGMVRDAFPGFEFIHDPLPLSITCHVGANAAGAAYIIRP